MTTGERPIKIYIFNQITKLFSDYQGVLEELSEQSVQIRFQPPGESPTINSQILLSVGENSGVRLYSCEVSAVDNSSAATRLVCNQPKLIDTFQRRQYLRVDLDATATVTVDLTPELAQEAMNQPLYCEGTIVNIGGGGMLFRTGQPLPTRSLLGFSFNLVNFGPIDVLGEVVRIIDREDSYEMGIKFVNMEPWLESELIHYVFQTELGQKKAPKTLKVAIMQLRLEVELPASFKIIRFGELNLGELFDKRGEGSIEQIDAQHMSVKSPLRLPINAELKFVFDLPGAGPMEVTGTIIGITSMSGEDNMLSIRLEESAEVERAISKFLFMQYIDPECDQTN